MRVSVSVDIQRPRLGGVSRRRLAAIAVAAVLLIPATAFATHQFTDVPDGHTFHGDIGKAKGAGLTAGCSPTTFCPDESVTRGQMTAFLNRGLGRLVRSEVSAMLVDATSHVAGSVTLRAGNPTGGSQLIFLIASVHAQTTQAGCPCELRIDIRTTGNATLSGPHYLDLPVPPAGDGISDDNATVQAMIAVPTGVSQTFNLTVAQIYGTSPDIDVDGEFHAMAVPFDGFGGNPIIPAAAGDDDAEPRR